jgi:hypothetical protein
MVLTYEQKRKVKEADVPNLEILFLKLSGWTPKNGDEFQTGARDKTLATTLTITPQYSARVTSSDNLMKTRASRVLR